MLKVDWRALAAALVPAVLLALWAGGGAAMFLEFAAEAEVSLFV